MMVSISLMLIKSNSETGKVERTSFGSPGNCILGDTGSASSESVVQRRQGNGSLDEKAVMCKVVKIPL
jgi:hypothetical protein